MFASRRAGSMRSCGVNALLLPTRRCAWRGFFGTTERFRLNLQTRYDLEQEKDRLGDRLNREVTVFAGRAPSD
jgi:hypothetical protein